MKKLFAILIGLSLIMICNASSAILTIEDMNFKDNFESKILPYFSSDKKKEYVSFENEEEIRNLSKKMIRLLFSRVDEDRVELLNYIEEQKQVKEIQELYNTIYNRKESLTSINFVDVYQAGNYYIGIGEIETSLGSLKVDVLLKQNDKKYELVNMKYDVDSSLNDYKNKVIELEKNDNRSEIVYSEDFSNFKIDNTEIDKKIASIYQFYSGSSIFLKAYSSNEIVSEAKGFFIYSGLVVTTWNFLKEALLANADIIISNEYNMTYEIEGVIDIDIENDIVVIKLNTNMTSYMTLYSDIEITDNTPILSLGSKGSYKNFITPGILLSHENAIISYLPLIESEQGSLLFNQDGRIIGINTSIIKDNYFSVALPNSYLVELQDKYKNMDFNSIPSTNIDEIAKNYRSFNTSDEKTVNEINVSIYEAYKSVGNIEENIPLPLVKVGNYYDYVSFRFKNNNSTYLSSISYSTSYQNVLAKDGYKLVTKKDDKIIYENSEHRVIIMDVLDYLIVVIEGKV